MAKEQYVPQPEVKKKIEEMGLSEDDWGLVTEGLNKKQAEAVESRMTKEDWNKWLNGWDEEFEFKSGKKESVHRSGWLEDEEWMRRWKEENGIDVSALITGADKEAIKREKIMDFAFGYKEIQLANEKKDKKEIRSQILKTGIDTISSMAGIKSVYSVPAYLKQRYQVRGVFGAGKGLEGSVEDLLAKNQQSHERIQTGDKEEHTDVKHAVKDLNKRLAQTKEGKVRGSEQRQLLAKMLMENRQHEKLSKEQRHEEITKILDDYTTTKVTGIEAVRDSLNTAFVASGAYALRGASYGIMDGVERYQNLKKEDRKKGEKKKVWQTLKDTVVGGVKNTWQDLSLQDTAGQKKSKKQKAISAIAAGGKVARYLGMGAMMEWHPETAGNSVDKLLEVLEGKASWSDVGHNFKGNAERLLRFYTAGKVDLTDSQHSPKTEVHGRSGSVRVTEKPVDYLINNKQEEPGLSQKNEQPYQNIVGDILEKQELSKDVNSIQADIDKLQTTSDANARHSLLKDIITKSEKWPGKIDLPNTITQEIGREAAQAVAAAENANPGLKADFNLMVGKDRAPGQIERVFQMMTVDHMKDVLGGDKIFGEEEGAKSLNVAENLIRLAQGHNTAGVNVKEATEAFSFNQKTGELKILDHAKFNNLEDKLLAHSDELWSAGKLQHGAVAYLDNIKQGTWQNIIEAKGLEGHVAGHHDIKPDQIEDFHKSKMVHDAQKELHLHQRSGHGLKTPKAPVEIPSAEDQETNIPTEDKATREKILEDISKQSQAHFDEQYNKAGKYMQESGWSNFVDVNTGQSPKAAAILENKYEGFLSNFRFGKELSLQKEIMHIESVMHSRPHPEETVQSYIQRFEEFKLEHATADDILVINKDHGTLSFYQPRLGEDEVFKLGNVKVEEIKSGGGEATGVKITTNDGEMAGRIFHSSPETGSKVMFGQGPDDPERMALKDILENKSLQLPKGSDAEMAASAGQVAAEKTHPEIDLTQNKEVDPIKPPDQSAQIQLQREEKIPDSSNGSRVGRIPR